MQARSFIFLFLLAISVFILLPRALPVFAQSTDSSGVQSQIDTITAQKAQLDAQIAQYQKQLNALGSQHQTLQTNITSLSVAQSQLKAKIASTQKSIDAANLQLRQLSARITQTQSSISIAEQAVGQSLRTIEVADNVPVIAQVLSAGSLTDAWTAIDTEQQLSAALQGHTQVLTQAKQTLSATAAAVGAKQQQLVGLGTNLTTQNRQLTATKSQQQTLLTQTKSQESTYQKLLAQAQAQLKSLSTFTTNAGGSGLLANQTSCDSWGCYYNQRDSQWGNLSLDGTQYRLASDGCLITSMAMVFTHYGFSSVTPVSVNGDSTNFDPYTHANLLLAVSAGGASATRVREPATTGAIDAILATGNPAIIGIHAYGGTHFVVFVSGAKGQYLMRDPYIPNAKDISFTAHYPLSSIYEVNKVVVSG